MQCHLETTSFVLPASIQRYQRGTFSFRPGEPLADFMLHFDHAPGTGHDDKFEIVSAAYRLRQSVCFQKSGGKVVCTICHNPHRAPRGAEAIAQYTAACRKCHEQKVRSLVEARRHPDQPDCIACHMAKRRTEDVIHAAMTDHRILRREPARNLLAPLAERHDSEGSYQGEVVLYYPPSLPPSADRDLYLAVAQVAQGSNAKSGIPQLEAALHANPPQRPEFYIALAQALQSAGRPAESIAAYRTASQHDARFAPALRGLGAALAKSGDAHAAAAALEQARALDPRDAATLHELALVYHDLGRTTEALALLQEAIHLDPDLPEIRNSLGNMQLESGDRDHAEESFREAVRSQPDLAAAYYGYGAALASRGSFDEAQRQIEEAVKLSPDFADAQTILGDLWSRRGNWREAMMHYRRALKVAPDSGRAHLGLGTALGATHDLQGAREHLLKAARDPNADVRKDAQELLSQLPGN